MRIAIESVQRRAFHLWFGALVTLLGAPIACGDGDSPVTRRSNPTSEGGAGGQQGVGEAGVGVGVGNATSEAGAAGSAPVACSVVTFVLPEDNAKLTEADDAAGPAGAGGGAGTDSCDDGFQYTVKAQTTAADGTTATLFAGTNQVASTKVSGGLATFDETQLPIGASDLKVQIGPESCTPALTHVTVSCNGIPTCDISKPVVSVTHPSLNGVPVAEGGDRASAAGSPYQVAFEVTTNVEDGQAVALRVGSSVQLVTAVAQGGKAQFPGVPLAPDGDYAVVATCQARSGKTSKSTEANFTVDTLAPDLAVTAPIAGKHFGPDEDSDAATAGQQFQVCGSTNADDALDLPDSLGAAKDNFCVALGTATPTCVHATGKTPCVTLNCQDRSSFDLKVTLGDKAGNSSASTVQGVSCSSSLPGVAIINPVDGTGADTSTHILSASTTNARKDENAGKAGAQFTVVACTDVAAAPMTLLGSVKGQTAQQLATTTSVAAVAADNCPAGKAYVGKFAGATLPESSPAVLGALLNPTELIVTVSDQGTVGTSPAVDVWVDSVAPSVGMATPNPLCGLTLQSATSVALQVTLFTSAVPLTATVTNSGTTSTYTATTSQAGQAILGSVNFFPGTNDLVATTTDPAGNPGALVSPCVVTVGNMPILSWLSPNGNKLNISSDTDSATPGWQGTVSVQTDVGGTGATVQFSTTAGNLGAPVAVNGSGVATSPVITLDDAASVKLTATTSDVPSRGVGTISQTVVVDTSAPSAITDLAASVPAALRRQTTFHLAWTVPIDAGGAVASYDVRVAKGTPITAGNFDALEQIGYGGTAAAVGTTDGVNVAGRTIENDYYFAVAPIDQAGNRGPLAAAGPAAAHFNSTVLTTGIAAEAFGYRVDGSTSLDGDAYSDLVVGAENSNTVYIYMGSATGYPSTPTSTIVGSSVGFGIGASIVGDIDSDGLPDLAIGSPFEGNGTVSIFKGRHPWPATLQQSSADYVVQAGSGFESALNGFTIAPLGDYNADNVDDFAVGALRYNGGGSVGGRISVVYGVANGSAFGTVSLPADYGTRALAIDGVTGQTLTGLGRYYAGGGTTLVASSPASGGRVMAFHGLSGQVGPVTTADQVFTGPLAGGRTGFGLAFLGGGGSVPVVGIGSSAQGNNPPNGRVDLFAGSIATGPFGGAQAIFTNSRATAVGDAFGLMVVGSAFSNGVTTSIIGDGAPDVVLGGIREGGAATHIYILTGQNAITPGTRDIVSAADVSYQMPLGWQGCSNYSGPIKDANGDGYADLAIGERRLTTGLNGQVLVLW